MIEFNLGCNFEEQFLEGVIKLNDKYKSKDRVIKELFGSDRQHSYLTARPDFRLPNINQKFLENFVRICNDNSIEFNYTLNAINPGSKKFILERKDEIIDFIRYLTSIGVKRVTASNILMMELINEANEFLQIEISTIMHIDTITQIKWICNHFNIDKVCGSILKNRNVAFLKNASDYCNYIGVKYEILANEFCGNGGIDEISKESYGTTCSLRDHCYILHSSNISKEDAELFDTYPMGYCMNSRMDPASWLKMRFVLPQDIDKYSSIGIRNFKISGRTGTTDYLLKIAEAYLDGYWGDNLLALWKQLETIYSEQKEFEFNFPYNINCSKLSDCNFIDHWFNNDFRCEEENCGYTCTYCNLIYKKIKE